jgi:hypothetical protein
VYGRKKYYTGEVYAKNMWPAARAYTPHKFKFYFDKVVDASPGIVKWLNDYHNLLWARSKFSTENARISLYIAWLMLLGRRH